MQLKSCNALEIIEKYPLNPSSYVMYNFLFMSKFLFLSSFFVFILIRSAFKMSWLEHVVLIFFS